jgi:hypothetical protein
MNKNTVISESYNLAIQEGFNSYLEGHATGENSEIKFDEDLLITQIDNKWLNQELADIGYITPKEYIDSLSSLAELFAFFIEIASVADVGVPDVVIDKMKEHGISAADKLYGFVTDSFDNKEKSDNLAVCQAIYAIGRFRYDEYKNKLIELLIKYYDNELISEAVCGALLEYNNTILDDLIKTFEAAENEAVKENLLICVANICAETPSDEIFFFLKNAFRALSNKKVATEVLGDYGDGRAIPLLRGYLLKNVKDMELETFNLIRAIIKKLGGEIDDLAYQMK